MMMWMMPLMLVWLTLALPSGVGVYWVTTNIFSVFASYYVYGRRAVSWRQIFLPIPSTAPGPAAAKPGNRAEEANDSETDSEETGQPAPTERVRPAHGKRRGKRKNRR
jgi:YidC/Oxa1 family membrane protein insertase